ncbi:hypothetical protein ACFVYC_10635 [Pseudarthrobacter sp. NPDC058329]|uniref:hypothetical protein n=1 Tax=Pseudarthrobacter sp. NPDC058329 TaxID=3346448 RepID=UPI0036DBEBA9
MNDFLSDALDGHEPLSDPLEEVNLRLAVAAADIAELRAEVLRLDRDLDESRRLNLRAAELLDLVHVQLAGNKALPLPGEVGQLITFEKAHANPASPAGPR